MPKPQQQALCPCGADLDHPKSRPVHWVGETVCHGCYLDIQWLDEPPDIDLQTIRLDDPGAVRWPDEEPSPHE
jgi:hypothetical protein